MPDRVTADNLPRPSTDAWPDVQQWWDVIRAALAEDYEDSHYCRRMLRQEGVELAYGDAEAIAALRDVWSERDAPARRLDAVRALCESMIPRGVMPERDLCSFDGGSAYAAERVLALIDGEACE